MAEEVRPELARLERAEGILQHPEPPKTQFSEVLTKLASDPVYRQRTLADPKLITTDYRLSLKELQALRQIAIMSGADVRSVNRLRANEFLARAAVTDVDVSCCSCCCCCCGETAVAPLPVR